MFMQPGFAHSLIFFLMVVSLTIEPPLAPELQKMVTLNNGIDSVGTLMQGYAGMASFCWGMLPDWCRATHHFHLTSC